MTPTTWPEYEQRLGLDRLNTTELLTYPASTLRDMLRRAFNVGHAAGKATQRPKRKTRKAKK